MKASKECILADAVMQLDTAHKALVWFGEEFLETIKAEPDLTTDPTGALVKVIQAYQWRATQLMFECIESLLGNAVDVVEGVRGSSNEYFSSVFEILAETNRKDLSETKGEAS